MVKKTSSQRTVLVIRSGHCSGGPNCVRWPKEPKTMYSFTLHPGGRSVSIEYLPAFGGSEVDRCALGVINQNHESIAYLLLDYQNGRIVNQRLIVAGVPTEEIPADAAEIQLFNKRAVRPDGHMTTYTLASVTLHPYDDKEAVIAKCRQKRQRLIELGFPKDLPQEALGGPMDFGASVNTFLERVEGWVHDPSTLEEGPIEHFFIPAS